MFGGKANDVDVPKTTAVTKQKLSTYFEDDGIRVNWECVDRNGWTLNMTCSESVIESIEATVTVPANGGTNFNGASANQIGQLESMAMIARFISEEITTERVVTLMAQNVEKADDTYRNPISGTGQNNVNAPRLPAVVGITSSEPQAPRDPNPNMNFAVTSNSNISKRDILVTIRSQAKIKIKGMQYTHVKADDQLLQTTGTWYKDVSDAVVTLKNSNF
jgi:hypothetical protein